MLGVHDDVRDAGPAAAGGRAGETVLLLGETRAGVRRLGLGRRSCTATSAAGRRRSTWPPSARSGELLGALGRDGLVTSAHDLADGGLAQALAESALRHGVGAPAAAWTATRSSPCSASPPPAPSSRRRDPAAVRDRRRAGRACRSPTWGRRAATASRVDGLLELGIAELRAAWSATLPALFGTPEATVGAVPAGAVPTS